jgi:hypothetical protein
MIQFDDYSWETNAAIANMLRVLARKDVLLDRDIQDLRSYAMTAAGRLDICTEPDTK